MTVRQQHCSDDGLLLYLDGELGRWRACKVEAHLRLCWECRSRLHSIQALLACLVDEVNEWRTEDSAVAALARERFLLKRMAEDRHVEPPRTRWRFGSPRTPVPVVVAAVLVLLVLSGFLLWGGRPRNPDAWALAQQFEHESVSAALLRQQFSLAISQTNPPRSFDSSVQIWRDHSQNRFSVIWRDANRGLLYGFWQTASDRELVYSSLEGEGIRHRRRSALPNSFADIHSSNIDLAKIEKDLANWFEGRESNPIALTKDCLLINRLPGMPPRQNGGAEFEWAQKADGWTTAVILKLGEARFEPRSQTIILANGGQTVTVRINLLATEALDGRNIPSQVFEPSTEIVMASTGKPTFWPSQVVDRVLWPVKPGRCARCI